MADSGEGRVYFERAGLLKTQGRLGEAVEAYRRAIRLQPDLAEAHNNLGNTLALLGRIDEAIGSLRRAVELHPHFAMARFNLANLLQGRDRLDEAVAEYGQALRDQPNHAEAHFNLGSALAGQERHEDARAEFARAARLRPDLPLWTLRAAVSYPTLFDSAEQEAAINGRLSVELNRLADARIRFDPTELPHAGGLPPYSFHFTKADVRPMKEAYARVFAPSFPDERPEGSGGRRRIGLVVTAGSESVFLRSMQGLLERIERGRFEFVVVCPGPSAAMLRDQIARPDVGFLPWAGRFADVVEAVRRARFDVLYYREVGTDPLNYFLPFFLLAPVQCTSFGIQVTSGIGRMDYYLSSSLVEPPDAAEHYSEKLILARTLLPYRRRAELPDRPKSRQDLGLPDEGRSLYVCAQHLGKFHPDFDVMLGEILRRDGRGVLAVLADASGHLAARLRARLTRTLPDVHDRIVFLPRLAVPDYRSLLAAADVLLDPPYFGGMNCTYDGLSLNRPIVTLPSPYHRGRVTLGCYRKMGLDDCVATNAEDYVARSVRLATEPDWREHVRRRLAEASGVLFEDEETVREHERIFEELLNER